MLSFRALLCLLAVVALQVPLAGPAEAVQVVGIEIRPGTTGPAPINMHGRDLSRKDGPPVPVAILSTPSFDARAVDPATVCFGDPNNATQRDCTESHGQGHDENIDGDGDIDLVLHFDINQLGLDQGDAQACLTGRTTSGTPIYACDAVSVTNAVAEAELPNLKIALVAEPSAANSNDTALWTGTVTNTGIGAITLPPGTELLKFEVPGRLSDVAISAPAGYSCAESSPGVRRCRADEPDTILVGGSRTFTLQGVLPSAPGPVEVTAVVDEPATVTELNEADNSASAASVVQAPNLRMSLVAIPSAVSPEDDIRWRAMLHNDGPGAAPIGAGAAVLRFNLPSGLTGVGFSPAPGFSCAGSGPGVYDCVATASTELAAGSAAVFEVAAQAPGSPGPITTTAIADPSGVIAESDESDNEASVEALVQNPNLVAVLSVTPQNPSSGEQVEWTVRVTNAGPTRVRLPAAAPLLALSYTPDLAGATTVGPAGYTCSSTGSQAFRCATGPLDVIAAGGDRVFRFTGTAPGSGDIDVSGTVDPDERVGEADETDNLVTGSTSVIVTLPDLTVSVTGGPDPVDAAHTASWVARVSNPSGVPVTIPSGTSIIRFGHPAGMLNLFASTPSGFSCFISGTLTVDCATTAEQTIAPGSSIDMTLGGTVPRQPGPITTTATVDPMNVVAETDETNNQGGDTITVRPPDFSTTLTASPDPVDAVASSTWVARITNDGPANARISNGTRMIRFQVPANLVNLAVSSPPNFTCFIEAPQTVDCQTTATQTLAAGAHLEFTMFGTTPRQPGPISMTAIADPVNVIPEGDETDNQASRTITVQPPDFSVTLAATPDPVDALASTTWAARITNDGPANARITTNTRMIRFQVPANLVNLAVSSPPNFTCFIEAPQTVDCQATATQNLAAGAHMDFTMFGTAPRQPGPISMTVTADPLGAIPEGDESDNSVTDSTTVQPPDFSVTIDGTPEPADASHSTSWAMRITNDGPANARITTNMRVIRILVPANLVNLAVSSPPNFTCFIEAPQTVDCQATATQNLAVGAHLDFTLFGTAPRQPGDISVTAIADPLDLVPEGDETDNQASDTITVRPPDFSIDLTGSPDPVAAGASVEFTGTVTNNGPARARINSALDVIRFQVPAGLTLGPVVSPAGYVCAVTSPGVIDCNSTSPTTLDVGASLTFTLQGTASSSGTLTVDATTDPDGLIPEENEANNSASDSINVS